MPANARPDASNARIAKVMALAETDSTAIAMGARSSSVDGVCGSPVACVAVSVASSGESANIVSPPVGAGVVAWDVEVGSGEVEEPATVVVGVAGTVVDSGDPATVVVGDPAIMVVVGVPGIVVGVVVGVPGMIVVVGAPGTVVLVVAGVPWVVVVTTVVVVIGGAMSAITSTASM